MVSIRRKPKRPANPTGEMPLMEHLGELRDRIIKVAVAVTVGAIAGWFLYPIMFDALLDPYCSIQGVDNADCRLLQTEPLETFSVRLKMAGYAGIAMAMPVILWQIWRFITPGLHKHEKRYAVPFVVSALALFILGAGLAYWSLPKAIEFLIDVGGDDNFITQFRPAPYFQLVTYMMLAFGVGFEFPVVLVFLQLVGLIKPETLRNSRRYAIVAIVVIVAVLTPSGDPYTLTILSIPMYLFYEASIVVGAVVTRRRRKSALAGA